MMAVWLLMILPVASADGRMRRRGDFDDGFAG